MPANWQEGVCRSAVSSGRWILRRPSRAFFRWAWYRAKDFRSRFWVGAAVFSLIVALVVSRLPLPPHPTATQNLIASVLAIVGATVMTGASSYACALVAAPFQQRNMLRTQLSESANKIADLRATPVPHAHGDRLPQIAARLRQRVEHGCKARAWMVVASQGRNFSGVHGGASMPAVCTSSWRRSLSFTNAASASLALSSANCRAGKCSWNARRQVAGSVP